MSFDNAEQTCTNANGHLASVTDAKNNNFLHNVVKGNAIIGAQVKNGKWTWPDGSPLTYENWEKTKIKLKKSGKWKSSKGKQA